MSSEAVDREYAAALINIQCIVSLLVMPITPVLWICVNGQVTTMGQRFSRMSPLLWSVFFPLIMSRPKGYFPRLLYAALWPEIFSDCLMYALLSALVVLGCTVGSHCVSIILRWGHGFVPVSAQNQTGSRSPSSEPPLSPLETQELQTWTQDLSSTKDLGLVVMEAVAVEYAWRVYLLPRLLYSVAPWLALSSMALLATLSCLPVVLYAVCVDTLTYPENVPYGDVPVLSRHPPSVATVLMHVAHQILLNFGLGILAMLSGFCLWPGVVFSLYWAHVAKIISGGMLISSYLPVGLELLARTKLLAGGKKISVAGWLRGTPWKVSCEGLSGCIASLPFVLVAYFTMVSLWQREALQRKSCKSSFHLLSFLHLLEP